MLSAHERNFKMPLPSTVVLDVKNERLRGQLSIKIIALMKQHLEDLAQKIGAGVGVSDREHGAVALDRATRYVPGFKGTAHVTPELLVSVRNTRVTSNGIQIRE